MNIIKLKINIEAIKSVEKIPKYFFRKNNSNIKIIDLKKTWILNTAIIENE